MGWGGKILFVFSCCRRYGSIDVRGGFVVKGGMVVLNDDGGLVVSVELGIRFLYLLES